jgi:hypothetical protein
MYLKISVMNEVFNPKVGLRALFSGPHWLAPYLEANNISLTKYYLLSELYFGI